MDPEISIIIPFFNSALTLNKAIESIINQNFLNWELILVDDGSTDLSNKIVQLFVQNPKVSYYYQENRGVSSARNFGASKAKGSFLIFLDADDQLRPGFFHILKEESGQASYFDYFIFGINRIKGKHEEISLPVDGQCFSRIPGTFAIRKAIFDQVGGYDSRFRFAENTELFHRLELIHAKGKNIPFVSLNYYDNPSGGSKNLKNMVDSLSLFLDIHNDTLTSHVKHLYHQIIGVNYLRFGMFENATLNLKKSLSYKFKLKTFLRYLLSRFPFLSKKVYK